MVNVSSTHLPHAICCERLCLCLAFYNSYASRIVLDFMNKKNKKSVIQVVMSGTEKFVSSKSSTCSFFPELLILPDGYVRQRSPTSRHREYFDKIGWPGIIIFHLFSKYRMSRDPV